MKVIDLNGPEGNVFVIIGYVTSTMQTKAEKQAFIKQMTELGDFEKIIEYIKNNFGDIVEFV